MKHNLLRVAAMAVTMTLSLAGSAQVMIKTGNNSATPANQTATTSSLSATSADKKADSKSEGKPDGCLYFDWRFPKHYGDIKGFDFSLGATGSWYFLAMEFAKAKVKGSKFAYAMDFGVQHRYYVAGDFWATPMVGVGFTTCDSQTKFNVMVEPRVGYNLTEKTCLYIGYRFIKPCGKGTADFGDCGGVALGIGCNW